MPENEGRLLRFDHVKFWVGNAKQAALWYCVHFGFEPYAYSGLETGSREVASHVIKRNRITFLFESAVKPGNKEFGQYLEQHGDSVKDVAFQVDHLDDVLQQAVKRGAVIIKGAHQLEDKNGLVRMATIKTSGDITHTLVERNAFRGLFLPGFQKPRHKSRLLDTLPATNLDFIDHAVLNQEVLQMWNTFEWYKKVLLFDHYWSPDDNTVITDYSALNSVVVSSGVDEDIKMPILEPSVGKFRGKSQAKEFVGYNGGPGIHHVALHTKDIIESARALRERGVDCLPVPPGYYDILKENLKSAKVQIREDLEQLKELGIMVDYDEHGYLCQFFVRPVSDRPTFLIEIIQKMNHKGFGAGNFKTLFQAIEMEQRKRGNLFSTSDSSVDKDNVGDDSDGNKDNIEDNDVDNENGGTDAAYGFTTRLRRGSIIS